MPQRIVVRVIERFLRPPCTKLKTSFLPALGTDEIRVRGVEIEKSLLEFREFEKVILLGDGFGRAAAVRTRIAGTRVHDIGVVVHAILAGIVSLLDETIFPAALEQPLDRPVVSLIRRPNELIARDSQIVPESASTVRRWPSKTPAASFPPSSPSARR